MRLGRLPGATAGGQRSGISGWFAVNGHDAKVGMRIRATRGAAFNLAGTIAEVQRPSVSGAMPLWVMVTFDGSIDPYRMSVEQVEADI